MPMRLDEGWNQIQFNLSDFTRRAYGMSQFLFICMNAIRKSYQKTPPKSDLELVANPNNEADMI